MRRSMAMGAMAVAIVTILVSTAAADTSVKPYVVPIGTTYEVDALWSVADTVPEASDPSKTFQMIGIPDGIGVHPNDDGTATVYLNHELGNTVLSEPVLGGALNRGALVSRLVLDEDGDVVAGERAYDQVFVEDTPIGPAAETDNPATPAVEGNATPGFGRFCSGSLAGPDQGFDRYIYLTNEETTGASSFDGRGGQSVAIFDDELHALPELGRFSKENTLVMSGTGQRTVMLSLEDGPATPDSQLYLFVGRKRPHSDSVLERNGLVDGQLYVFRSTTPGANSEATFAEGTIGGEWVRIPGAEGMTDVQLETAVDALGAFAFVRPEDGAFDLQHRNLFHFVTTGSSTGGENELGRLYTLQLNPGNVLGNAGLHVVYNADEVIADGGDTAISPDNVDVGEGFLMINEDGTTESRLVMAAKGREGSVWRFDLGGGPWTSRVDPDGLRVAELDPPGRDGIPVGPGVWETSGIVDASAVFGPDTWLTDVQAHSPTTAPAPRTVEDGQLLLITPAD